MCHCEKQTHFSSLSLPIQRMIYPCLQNRWTTYAMWLISDFGDFNDCSPMVHLYDVSNTSYQWQFYIEIWPAAFSLISLQAPNDLLPKRQKVLTAHIWHRVVFTHRIIIYHPTWHYIAEDCSVKNLVILRLRHATVYIVSQWIPTAATRVQSHDRSCGYLWWAK
jgi:hypothetical protein